MATDKEVDAQFEQTILETLRTMTTGMITIIKLNNQVIQVNIDENYSACSEEKRPRARLTLISDKDAG